MTFDVIIMFYHIIRTYLTVSTFYLVITTHHGNIIFKFSFHNFLGNRLPYNVLARLQCEVSLLTGSEPVLPSFIYLSPLIKDQPPINLCQSINNEVVLNTTKLPLKERNYSHIAPHCFFLSV